MTTDGRLLEIEALQVQIGDEPRAVYPLQGISFGIERGTLTGLVGESGSGKSMTALALLRLLPEGGRFVGGKIVFDHRDLLALSEEEMRDIRGKQISMVFQNATAALNPLFPVGRQIADVYRFHERVSPREAWEKAVGMLDAMGIPNAAQKATAYPHQYSGGMAQRAMIAMALVCSPKLLIADEPTTGLDVTIQAQVLDLIVEEVRRFGASLLLISHDIAVVADVCKHVVVMYAGRILESGPVETVLRTPANPYTQALIDCFRSEGRRLRFIPGTVPDLRSVHRGCPFAGRCPRVAQRCLEEAPVLREIAPGHQIACHFA